MRERAKSVFRDAGVVVAFLAAVSSVATTFIQTKSASDDRRDEYAVTSVAVNSINERLGVLEGRMSAPSQGTPQLAEKNVIDLGEIVVEGHSGKSDNALPDTLEEALAKKRTK